MISKDIQLEEAIKSFPFEKVFDCLNDTVFFIKDKNGRYCVVNNTFAVRCGVKDKASLIGKTPSEVMGELLGKSYEAQDRAVTKTRNPVTDQLELHVYANKRIGWCITNKRPVISSYGKVVGVVGISQDLRQPDLTHEDFVKLSRVIDYIRDNISVSPKINYLSKIVGLSPFQLDLRVQRIFGLTTGQWVLKQRLDFARQELMGTNDPIVDIALSCGYSDQSTFTRQFRKMTGLTPGQFRDSSHLK